MVCVRLRLTSTEENPRGHHELQPFVSAAASAQRLRSRSWVQICFLLMISKNPPVTNYPFECLLLNLQPESNDCLSRYLCSVWIKWTLWWPRLDLLSHQLPLFWLSCCQNICFRAYKTFRFFIASLLPVQNQKSDETTLLTEYSICLHIRLLCKTQITLNWDMVA